MKRRHSMFPQFPPSGSVQDCGHRAAFLMTAEDAGGEQGAGCALCLLEDFMDSDRLEVERNRHLQEALTKAKAERDHCRGEIEAAQEILRRADIPLSTSFLDTIGGAARLARLELEFRTRRAKP